MTPQIAVLDDEQRMAEILAMVLRTEGYNVRTFSDADELLSTLETETFDLLLTDLKMPKIGGLEVLARAKQINPAMPVILVTAHATVQTAVAAIREGAFDYVEKPFDNDHCRKLVRRALDHTSLQRENRYLRGELKQRYRLDNAIFASQAMRDVLDLVQRAAASRSTVLIQGASGTGKEIIARAIHYYSDRVGQPFEAINCKALAGGVLESELFGHEKGAFTGAHASRAGLFERAAGGTVFLDEIGEIDASFQAKLLRVLQEHEVTRVGGSASRSVDVRVVAATNRDLNAEVKAERFREDLFFRLAVIPIALPALRDRRDDILPLARHFLLKYGTELDRKLIGWDQEFEQALLAYDWPGNVRELENAIERAVVLARDDELNIGDLLLPSPNATEPATDAVDTDLSLAEFVDDATAGYVRRVLEEVDGVRVDAAKRLGIERTTLYRLIKKYGL